MSNSSITQLVPAEGLTAAHMTYNSVDTGEVLQEEEHVTKKEAPEHSVVGQSKANRLDESGGQIVDLEIHHLNLLNDVRVLGLQLPVPAKVGDTLLTSAPRPQPARCLSKEKKATDEDHTSWDQLDSKRDEPLVASVGDALGHAEVDPEAN